MAWHVSGELLVLLRTAPPCELKRASAQHGRVGIFCSCYASMLAGGWVVAGVRVRILCTSAYFSQGVLVLVGLCGASERLTHKGYSSPLTQSQVQVEISAAATTSAMTSRVVRVNSRPDETCLVSLHKHEESQRAGLHTLHKPPALQSFLNHMDCQAAGSRVSTRGKNL